MQCAIARGDPGFRGRYIPTRQRDIANLLDRLLGKPTQPVKADATLTVRVVEGDDPGPDDAGI